MARNSRLDNTAHNLGLGCRDDDKYSDPEAWSDPYFCCDKFFTNAGAFELHKMMAHARMDVGGRGRGGGKKNNGKGKSKGKGNAMPMVAPPMTATPPAHYFGDYSDYSKDFEPYDVLDYFENDYDSDDPEDDYICGIMGMMAMSTIKSPTKSKTSASKLPYSCSKCKEWYAVKAEYLLHMALIHRECGACDYTCKAGQKTSELWDHDHNKSSPTCRYNPNGKLGVGGGSELEELSHSGSGDRFICFTCGHNPGSGFALNQHYATAHTKCWTCKIQFDTVDDLYKHFSATKVHDGDYCEICKMVFSSKKGFSDHWAASHSEGESAPSGRYFPCDVCPRTVRFFNSEDELDAHIQFDHVRCFPCKREFTQQKSLYQHLTTSSQHNFCIRCESDFLSSESFSSHECLGKDLQKSYFFSSQNRSMEDHKRSENDRSQNPIKKFNPATFWREKALNRKKQPISGNEDSGAVQNAIADPLSAMEVSDKSSKPIKESIPPTDDSKDEEDLSCCTCQKYFDTLEDRKWHEYDSHLWCTKCNKQLASRRAFNEHQLTSKGHNLCFECWEYFAISDQLRQHQLDTDHISNLAPTNIPSECSVKTKKFVCDDCDYNVLFKTEKELAKHLNTKH